MIYGNHFKDTFSFFSTQAIFIRNVVSALAEEDNITLESDLNCGGYLVQDNEFENNFSCPLYGGGVFKFECIS